MTKANLADIRWQQRLSNFDKALSQLRQAVTLKHQRTLTELEIQGTIKAFEFTHELAWNVMKDFFFEQGNSSIMGSKDAIREAFQHGIISDGQDWMDMIRSRNLSSHTYNEGTAGDIIDKVYGTYFPLFETFSKKMNQLKSEK